MIYSEDMNQTLKEIRKSKNLTQEQAALLAGISLRSYISYENDESKNDSMKYKYMMELLAKYNAIDEEHGIVSLSQIQEKCKTVFDEYNLSYVYLFGSYAKGTAKETSDVDILISSEVKGLKFYGFVEKIKNVLQKKVDVLDVGQLKDNPELLNEILKDGIKIYG